MTELADLLVADPACPDAAVAALLLGPGAPPVEAVARPLTGTVALTLAARGADHAAVVVSSCRDDETLRRLLHKERRLTVLEAAAANEHLPADVARWVIRAAARWPSVAANTAVNARRLPLAEALELLDTTSPGAIDDRGWGIDAARVATTADLRVALRSPSSDVRAAALAACVRLRALTPAAETLDRMGTEDRQEALCALLELAVDDPGCTGRVTAAWVRRLSTDLLVALLSAHRYVDQPGRLLSPTGTRAAWQLVCDELDRPRPALDPDSLAVLVECVLPADRAGMDTVAQRLESVGGPTELATALALRGPSSSALPAVTAALVSTGDAVGVTALLARPLATASVRELLVAATGPDGSGGEVLAAWLSGAFAHHRPDAATVRVLLGALADGPGTATLYSVFRRLGYGDTEMLLDDTAARAGLALGATLDPYRTDWLDGADDDVRAAVTEFVRCARPGRLHELPNPVGRLYAQVANEMLTATGADPELAWPLAVALADDTTSLEALTGMVAAALQ